MYFKIGGKSPQLVFDDADLDAALPVLVRAGLQNAGQTCSASSRLLLQRGIYERVVAELARRYRALRAGPAARDLDLGPLISAGQLRRVMALLEAGHPAAGAPVLARGEVAADAPAAGHYFAPLLLGPLAPQPRRSRRRRSSGRCRSCCPSPTRTRRSRSRTARATAWSPAPGRAMRAASTASRAGCAPARCSSTTTGRPAAWSCPSAASAGWGTAARKGMEALYGFTTLKTVAARHR